MSYLFMYITIFPWSQVTSVLVNTNKLGEYNRNFSHKNFVCNKEMQGLSILPPTPAILKVSQFYLCDQFIRLWIYNSSFIQQSNYKS